MTPMMVFLQRKTGISPRLVPLMKTCTELFVYWYYFTSVLYHLAMGLMEGIGLPATIERVRRNFWKTATSAWIYWCAGPVYHYRPGSTDL